VKIEMSELSNDYQIIRYPGGELQVRLMGDTILNVQKCVTNGTSEVDIIARITKSEDIIVLGLLHDAVNALDKKLHIHCWLPYLPYARADRRFVDGDCFGLEVFAKFINAMEFDSVITYDAHSDVAKTLIKRLCVVVPQPQIRKAIIDFAKFNDTKKICVLFPDAGAATRYKNSGVPGLYEDLEIEVKYATKKRDAASGKFIGFEVPEVNVPTIIVDDICDGGGTFLGIAEHLTVPLGLWTTHGIYSKGLDILFNKFQRLYCMDTFSYITEANENFKQYPITRMK